LLPPLAEGFAGWLHQRGLAAKTVKRQILESLRLLTVLGEDTMGYRASDVRQFITRQSRLRRLSVVAVRGLVGALRAFLSYLVVHGRCHRRLVDALPKLAPWHGTALPRYISSSDVERAVSSPCRTTAVGIRDRAILLLLARLGARAGEVARLQLADVDCARRRIRLVASKTAAVAWLPLPGDVQRSLRLYIQTARPSTQDTHVFVRTKAPYRAACGASMITHVAVKALRKAGVDSPVWGAYVFRHSIATKLLGKGWTLDAIGALLRHRHRETTSIYAKVDFHTLRLVIQKWPSKRTP
jgi:site-specific recombinase XerD